MLQSVNLGIQVLSILLLQLFSTFAGFRNKKVKEIRQDVVLCTNGLEGAIETVGPGETERGLGPGRCQ